MKSRGKTKRVAGGGLTTKEKRILAMARHIEREAKRLQNGLPKRYYRHGHVSIAAAAKQLDCERKRVDVLINEGRIHRVGIRGGFLIPISEIRRQKERDVQSALENLVLTMWKKVLRPRAFPEVFDPWRSRLFHPCDSYVGVNQIAERLHITPNRVRRLIKDDGPDSLAGSSRRPVRTTRYELEAFEKAHGQELQRDHQAT